MNIQYYVVRFFKNHPDRIRSRLYSLFGIKTNSADIRENVMITAPQNLILGKNVLININCSFVFGAGNAKIIIGDNVQIAPNCLFITINHDYSNPEQRAGDISYKNIHIGDGAWIGCNSTILGGVTIGKGSVIAAGAVVTKDVPDNQLYGGVPSRFIKNLSM